jgi:type I restriction enzyme M protein
MLDSETKRRIDTARDILVGKVPDPKSQVEQITIALIYKFMDDMDLGSEELGGERSFFKGEFEKYAWRRIFDPRMGGFEILNLYSEAIMKMNVNPNIPQLFRDIFKNAYLPYRDPETLKAFLKIINEFTYDHSECLGDAFEYLLSVLGSQGEAGQFRTPRHIIDFMVANIDPKKDEVILDPACGTAGFLISSYKHIIKNNSTNYDPKTDTRMFETKDLSLSEIVINSKNYTGDKLTPDERNRLANSIKGYDISPDMVRLSLVNMYLHGLRAPHIYEYDTLTSEDNWNEYADVILANPPFMSPKGGIRPHKRFSISSNRSEVLFVDYITEHLTPNGRAAVIVPEGIIFQSGTAYKSLRKMLVENYLVGVISLPAGVFQPYSGVKTSILWLDRTLAKKTDKILFIKIENDGFDLGAQRRPIKQNDLPNAIKHILEYKYAINYGSQLDSQSLLTVTKEYIYQNGDYNLSADRYRISSLKLSDYDWVPIKELTDLMVDGDWVESKDQSGSGIRLIQTGNIGVAEYLDKPDNARFISEETFVKLKCTEVFPGDLLLSRLPDPVGRACLIPELRNKLITAVDCTIIRFNKKRFIPKLFAYYSLLSKYYDELAPFLTGSSRRRISRKNLEAVRIPVPPLSIQEEIVTEIESYQKIIDGARQVVENYKPRIDIDPEWPMVALGKVCDNYDYMRKPVEKSNRKPGPYPYYGASGIVDFVDSYIFDGDYLLLSEDGANLLARSTPIAFSITGKNWINNHAHILKFESLITQKFVETYLNQTDLTHYITGMAQPKLNQAAMNKVPIPIPKLDLQKEIVDKIKQEENAIKANNLLINSFEQKIKYRIAKVWGE